MRRATKVIKVGVGGGGSKSYVVGTGWFESGGVGCNETTNIPNSRPRDIAELKRSYSHCYIQQLRYIASE
jgi:aryl-phospho-beta-D-glucosidase BglC (GH1 family)